MENEQWEQHPSFGMISVTRAQAGGKGLALFGSDAYHHHVVQVELRTGKRKYGLSHDWFYGDKTVASWMMTEGQWARFVSSFGDGGGTPITFRHRMDLPRIPSCPDPKPIIDPFNADVEERINIVKDAAKGAKAKVEELLAAKKPATKEDLRQIRSALDSLIMNVDSNLHFVETSFKEKMQHHLDQTIVNFEQQLAHSLQMKGLGDMQKYFKSLKEGDNPVVDTPVLLPPQQQTGENNG